MPASQPRNQSQTSANPCQASSWSPRGSKSIPLILEEVPYVVRAKVQRHHPAPIIRETYLDRVRWKFTTVASNLMSRKEVRILNLGLVPVLIILLVLLPDLAIVKRRTMVVIYHVVSKLPNRVKLARLTSVTSNHQSNLTIVESERSTERTHPSWPNWKLRLKRRSVIKSRLRIRISIRQSCVNSIKEQKPVLMVTNVTTPMASHSSTRPLSRMRHQRQLLRKQRLRQKIALWKSLWR